MELAKYIAEPYNVKLAKNVLYRWLKVLKMPSSRQLMVLRQALKLLKSRGTAEESMEMNMLLCHPECAQWLLTLILKTCLTV
jgi:hypothetical protein